MKASNLIGFALGAGLCVGLYACGGHDDTTPVAPNPPVAPAPPATVMLSVNDVLTLAKAQSETSDPQTVNGGTGGMVTGSDETSDPVSVD
jgi:hypothetical protein